MVEKFREKHQRLPAKIVVAPVALVALGLKSSVAPVWNGLPVECRLFKEGEVVTRAAKSGSAVNLGIFVKEKRGRFNLVACDLNSI
jgi:hypothetical protein